MQRRQRKQKRQRDQRKQNARQLSAKETIPSYDNTISLLLREIIASGTPLHLKVTSQSMAPLLQSGDIVFVARASQTNCLPGDLIVFEKDQTLTTHRLLAKKEIFWVCKGDKALSSDPPLKPDCVLGKVSGIQRGKRTWSMSAHPWPCTNRILGRIHSHQIHLVNLVKGITSRLFGGRQIRGISYLHKLLAIPFRLLTKILIQFSVKRCEM
ncbi:MAG: hypothetical protein MAG431_01725 [Chloroflexi bacterium]|nr:hypothetical protein [Chloroflexota bacterium]